jgi:class 3 adenylate cyclase
MDPARLRFCSVEIPETRYVDSGDGQVAYQVVGSGPIDLLVGWGLGSQVDLIWDVSPAAHFLERLASFSRVIQFDRRGTGASDAMAHESAPTWEQWVDDVRAVLDKVHSERTAILASYETCATAILFAATYPERTSDLVLWNPWARILAAPDYPEGISPDAVEKTEVTVRQEWGTTNFVASLALPSRAGDARLMRAVAKLQRASATPRAAAAQVRYAFAFDVREALPLVAGRALVLFGGNPDVPSVAQSRYVAEHLRDARFVEGLGRDVAFYGNAAETVLGQVEEFLTGARRAREADRVLATVLFTDIVGSTERAAAMGDRAWRTLLNDHNRAVRAELARFRGREISTTGDGFFAAFDGPARAIRCACAIREAVGQLGIEIRAGVHTGEVEMVDGDLRGLTVHIGARIAALAGASEVLVSRTVADLVAGSGITLVDRGEHDLRGIRESWRLFAVTCT